MALENFFYNLFFCLISNKNQAKKYLIKIKHFAMPDNTGVLSVFVNSEKYRNENISNFFMKSAYNVMYAQKIRKGCKGSKTEGNSEYETTTYTTLNIKRLRFNTEPPKYIPIVLLHSIFLELKIQVGMLLPKN
ncbi:MAG: hypothetical protein WAQ28_12990 [Bacteroidia bacterium]